MVPIECGKHAANRTVCQASLSISALHNHTQKACEERQDPIIGTQCRAPLFSTTLKTTRDKN